MGSLLRAQWDRVAAWAAAIMGALLLLIGYIKVSGTAYPAEQIPYLVSAGLGALFLLGIAGTLWIGADLRDEYAKLDEIAGLLSRAASEQRPASSVTRPAPLLLEQEGAADHTGVLPARGRRTAAKSADSTADVPSQKQSGRLSRA